MKNRSKEEEGYFLDAVSGFILGRLRGGERLLG